MRRWKRVWLCGAPLVLQAAWPMLAFSQTALNEPAVAPATVYYEEAPCTPCTEPRTKLTGDWYGHRPCLAERGITFDYDQTMVYQGVTHGGRDEAFAFGGHGDYVTNFDFGKLGIQEGLLLKLRAEHRYGDTAPTGSLLPSALIVNLPKNDVEDLALTNVLLTQFLSEEFAVFAGKLDTLDGDMNAFAHGRGKDQFLNSAMVFNPIAARGIPYSTLGAGFVILRDLQPIFTFTVLNAVDTATTSGFDSLFEEGVALSAQLRLPTEFWGLPGHQLFGAIWNSREFSSLNQDPRVVLPNANVPIATEDGTWSLFWNGDQTLVTDPCDPSRGWGVFARAGISDADPNPIAYFLSAGFGGNSPWRGREADTFGIGWFYSGLSNELGPLVETILQPHDGQGVELFYNYAVTPYFHLTPDIQVLEPALGQFETTTVIGLRGKLDF